jgi:hypothetical protein
MINAAQGPFARPLLLGAKWLASHLDHRQDCSLDWSRKSGPHFDHQGQIGIRRVGSPANRRRANCAAFCAALITSADFFRPICPWFESLIARYYGSTRTKGQVALATLFRGELCEVAI